MSTVEKTTKLHTQNIKGAPFEELPRLESAPIIECLLYNIIQIPDNLCIFRLGLSILLSLACVIGNILPLLHSIKFSLFYLYTFHTWLLQSTIEVIFLPMLDLIQHKYLKCIAIKSSINPFSWKA